MGSEAPRLSVNRIREKDIDLLLLEECMAATDFWRWLLAQAFPQLPIPAQLLDLTRSVGDIQGESDLELTYLLPDGTLERLLIENKINAELQPRQASRYRTRGQQYIARGTCSQYRTVLACPARYLGARPTLLGFDAVVTYEQVRNWFRDRVDLGWRGLYKQAVLNQAIASCEASYVVVPDATVTSFWYDYWRLATERAPQLGLQEPGDRPSHSGWIRFAPNDWPHGLRIMHKLSRGVVQLEFARFATYLALFDREFGATLESDMTLTTATQAMAVRLTVPMIDRKLPVERQPEQAIAGIDAAARLHSWFLVHREKLVPWLQEQRPTVFRPRLKKRSHRRRTSGAGRTPSANVT